MARILIFGLGYTAARVADALRGRGWTVDATGSAGNLRFDDAATVAVVAAQATHILSSVPPVVDGDPVLGAFGDRLAGKWLGYLSSTGVYGDTGGGWVDESAPVRGRRESRNVADAAWLERGARVFRLPGIYGPDRSALDRIAQGKAHRVALPDQVFSRVHVDDIASGVLAALDAPPGAYNLADDLPCDQNAVVACAASLLRAAMPAFVALEDLSPMARGFYAENRRIANGKAKRILGWTPRYPDFTSGLRALSATRSPPSASAPPPAASNDQR